MDPNAAAVSHKQRAEADAVAEIATKAAGAQLVDLGVDDTNDNPVQVLVTAPGMCVSSLKKLRDEYLQAPERRSGIANLLTLQSFIDHANRFKDADSAIFANEDPKAPSLLAVYDFHRQGPTGTARFGRHRAVYSFPLSDEWIAWTAQEGKAMSQEALAAFLEERIPDIGTIGPGLVGALEYAAKLGAEYADPSRLLELSRNLQISVGQFVQKATNLGTGEAQFVFREEHATATGAPLRIPRLFLLSIPVFVAGEPFALPVRLNYKVSGGSISFTYEIVRRSYALRLAVQEAAKVAQTATALPLFYGVPEQA